MYSYLNVGSLMFGLIAWILPIVRISFLKKRCDSNGEVFSLLSFSACAISLCFQIFYTNHLVDISDWSALLDTMYAVSDAAGVLLVITVILNAIVLLRYRTYKKV